MTNILSTNTPYHLTIINQQTEKQELLDHMFHLRHQVFKEKLGWSVVSQQEKEFDEYDQLVDVKYILVTDKENLLGCMRLLPTTGQYMLKNTFSSIGKNISLPAQKDVWEITRFAVNNQLQKTTSFNNFGEVSSLLIYAMCDFAIKNNIRHYITLTTPYIEKLVKKIGLTYQRISSLENINDLDVVVLQISIDQKSMLALINKTKHLYPSVEHTYEQI